MISDVGRALCSLLRPQLPASAAVRVGAPAGAGGADGATGPAVHLVLCWLRDDPKGRQSGDRDVRAEDGTLIGRQSPPRRYELRYLVTARAESAEAEHELLDGVLMAVTGLDAIPAEHLPKDLADTGLPVFLEVSSTPLPTTSVMPVHAAFELNVNAPLLPPMQTELAPPAAELAIGMRRTVPPRPPSPLTPQPAAGGGRQWRRARVSEDGPPSGPQSGPQSGKAQE